MSEVISDVESRALVKIFGGGKLMFGGVSDVGTRWLRLVVPTGELRWILQKEKFALDDAQVKTLQAASCIVWLQHCFTVLWTNCDGCLFTRSDVARLREPHE
jgi:hypothetical protein